MSWLAIDTTGVNCTVALRLPGGAEYVLSDPIGRGHAERLAPMVERLLEQAEIEPGSITRIGVTTGPGSFAGTRVGVAFARGLALACQADCIGVSNLALLARQVSPCPCLAVLHDAKRGEIILQVWRDGQTGGPERCALEGLEARIRQLGGSDCVITGSGARYAGSAFDDLGVETLDPTTLLVMTGELPPADFPPAPFYARPPDAKLPGGVDPA